MSDKKRAQWAHARAAVTVLWQEISPELDRGQSMIQVYRKLEPRLGMSYRRFIYWVRYHQQQRKEMSASPSQHQGSASPVPPVTLYQGPRRSNQPPPKTFVFDPEEANRLAEQFNREREKNGK
jgi:hypothetical protein